jgi:hypothetical protein
LINTNESVKREIIFVGCNCENNLFYVILMLRVMGTI